VSISCAHSVVRQMSEPVLQAHPHTGADRLRGRRAVITGAARGIGAEIARVYASHGAEVALIDISADRLAQTAAELGCPSFGADLRDPDAARTATADAVRALGGIDILVNNAGILRFASVLDMTVEDWDLTFEVNARSMLLTTQVAARVMIEQGSGGRIVNMASMGGKLGAPGQAHYCAAKAAVIAFTRVCAMEFGAHRINVNCICPGYVLSEMGAATRTAEMVEAWSAKSPLGRLAQQADVANMALFCATADSEYCTGQAFNVSGGMVMH
jgi:NAD(P)-dependent dehydrogenase (short-subunit alcohol dehydrogenase family)